MHFSESSNVILKNSALLGLLVAATESKTFNHPRFLLMDNVEDKGMTQERSRNFQELIVKASNTAETPHQIIFTTSMMNPSLEDEAYTVGPIYSDNHKTLRFPKGVKINDV